MENSPKQQEEGKQIIRVLSCVLNKLIEANMNTPNVGSRDVTKFHALEPPTISVLDYLERIHKYACCSNECFILSLIYIDRLIQLNNFALTALNVHRVIITSVMLGAKFFDDQYFNNAYYAKVGGVPVTEMNLLEVELLFRLNFSLYVNTEIFKKYQSELSHHATINFCKCVSGKVMFQADEIKECKSSQNPALNNKASDTFHSDKPQNKVSSFHAPVPSQVTATQNPLNQMHNGFVQTDCRFKAQNFPPPSGFNSVQQLVSCYPPTYTPHVIYPQHATHPKMDPPMKSTLCATSKPFSHSGWGGKSQGHLGYFQDANTYAVLNEIVR
jgi:hypothetical protein